MDIDEKTLVILIKATAAVEYGVSIVDIESTARRAKNISSARRLAQYLTRENTTFSYPEIGALFSADQSSVRYAVRRMRKDIYKNTALLKRCVEINTVLNSMKG